VLTNQAVNDVAADFVRERIKAKVNDPAVAEILAPQGHPIGTKRICVDLEYFETFNRPNVALVDVRAAPIQAITPTGLRTTEGEYELDALVLATGFDAMTGALTSMDITGVGGARLKDAWAAGPAAYLGLAVADFPNLFIVTGPGSPSVLSNMLVAIEQHVDWITDTIGHLHAKGLTRIEAQPDAQAAWVAHVKATADSSLFPKANSWYMGANIPGKPRVFPIYIGDGYRRKCEDVAAKGYEGFKVA
jgi:cyclohexanone monooxygenase